METSLIVLFSVFGASVVTLVILLLSLIKREPGKTVVVIKDKRTKKEKTANKETKEEKKPLEPKKDELILEPIYCSIKFECDKCQKSFLVQEQKLTKDIICPKCKETINKQEQFKKVLKAELKSQTKEQELFLGMCYLYGVGVKKDDEKAYLFVNLSAYNGDKVAKEMLKNYYSEEIAKLTKENIKDATGDKLTSMIKEQKINYSKIQFEPKTINELHNYAIDYLWWGEYHRMNCFDVDALASVGGANINSHRIMNMFEGYEEIDFNSLESRLAFAYLDVAAKNGRYDLYAELGFAYVGSDNEKAKYYLKKGIECGDERSKELYAVYFEGKTLDQVRIEKIEAPKQVILLEQKPKSIKAKEKSEAKEASVSVIDESKKEETKEISADEVFGAETKEVKAEKKDGKKEEKKAKKSKKADEKKESKKEEKKPTVVKKTKSKEKKEEKKPEVKKEEAKKEEKKDETEGK